MEEMEGGGVSGGEEGAAAEGVEREPSEVRAAARGPWYEGHPGRRAGGCVWDGASLQTGLLTVRWL